MHLPALSSLALGIIVSACIAGDERRVALDSTDVLATPDLVAPSDGDVGSGPDGSDATVATEPPEDATEPPEDATEPPEDTTEPPEDSILSPEDATDASDGHDAVALLPIDLPALRLAVDEYLDRRWDGHTTTDALVARLEESGATQDDIEAVVRGGRATYPDVSGLVGLEAERPVTCSSVDYASSYYLAVPESYDPELATGVLVVAHGGATPMDLDDARASAREALGAYAAPFLARGLIVIAPVTTRGWSPIGDAVVFDALSDLSRSFHVDPDRIYVAGYMMGGHMAWRAGITHGDRFAAFAPSSGGYVTWPADGRLGNLFGTHGVQTWCETEPYDIREANLGIRNWLVGAGYDWNAYALTGDSHAPLEDLEPIADTLADARRDIYPTSAYLWGGGSMRYDHNWTGQTETIHAARAYRWNLRHWLEIIPNLDSVEPVAAFASVIDDHTISVVSNRVRSLRLWLHPAMGLDLEKPLRVIVNDQVRFEGPVATDLAAMLELVREYDDRGRIYRAHVEVSVETDRVVGTPHGPGAEATAAP